MASNTSTLTRRETLTLTGAALLSTWPRASFARADKNNSKGRVRFAVRSPLTGNTLQERAALLKKLGYHGIELGPEWVDQPADDIKSQLAPTGIQVSAIVGSLELLNTDPMKRAQAIELDRRRLHKAKALNAYGVIEVPVRGANRFQDLSPLITPIEIQNGLLVAALKQLAPTIEQTGVKLLIEPLAKRYTHFMNRQQHALEIIESVGSPGVQLLSDFYHMQFEETNIPKVLERCAKHVGYLHCADAPGRLVPGSTGVDYRQAFRVLKEARYSGWLTVEAISEADVQKELTLARKFLEDQWNSA